MIEHYRSALANGSPGTSNHSGFSHICLI